jgi:cell division protein FtsI/penicillin-binding protein 2
MGAVKYNTPVFRAKLLFTVVWAGFLICLVRIGWLQLALGDEMAARAAQNNNILRELKSPRGAIYDREGRELAVSLISLSFYVDPLAMDEKTNAGRDGEQRDARRLAASLLAPELDRKEEELYGIFTSDRRFVWLERTMDKSRTDRIDQILKTHKLSGFGFLRESKRYYPMGSLGAQVLGFVGTDDYGLSGIEMAFDSFLKSAVQPQFIETDIAGRPVFSSVLADTRAPDMGSIHLTLDNRIQYAAEKALSDTVRKTGARGATALVMDVRTGDILAMVSNPSFDPNRFYNYPEESWINKNVSMIYEPGSTFKPLVASFAINEDLISPQTMVYDRGSVKVDGHVIINSEQITYGLVPFSEVLAQSINTSMVEVGFIVGKEKMNEYIRALGFGLDIDIDLPGVEQGLLFETKEMRPIDVASMSIGQGIAVTPLQLVQGLSALSNGGAPVRPRIIQKITAPDGTPRPLSPQPPPRQVLSAATCRTVLAMMENVVTNGAGTLAKIPGYRIAGKTGTAEKVKSGGGYAKNEYIASFVGIAPAEDPRFIVLVLIDTPHSNYYGSQIAAPVFKEIMQQTLTINGIEPNPPGGLLPPAAPREQKNQERSALKTQISSVPDLTGLTMRECAKILQQNGLSLIPRGSGLARRQDPPAFLAVKNQTAVTVWFE